MPAWINIKRNQFESSEHEDYAVVDVNSFSEMQRLAYDIVCRHFENTSEKEPLLLIIIGVAGTGKSYLINGIRSLLQKKMCCNSYNRKGLF